MSRLSNKVAIVTGASKGIGAGIATALAAEGARVCVNYSSDREGAERVAKAITGNGGEAIAVGADVSKAAEVVQLFKEVDSAFGRLDVLVNNAGVFRFGAVSEITEQAFHLHFNINVLGVILTVQEAIKRFGSDGGSIINLSSIVGSHPVPGALLYASTKGAIETLTRGLAIELAPRKIRVNAIAPGHTETEGNATAGTFEGGAGAALAAKTPLGRLGRVTDIAPLAVFLASDESAWITGEVIRAAGGLVVAT
ncbi:MAG TPA: glucose 1-dehydrogenase [Candidatus Sulfotelmatobacter sp.]|jgi:3-oxoacyl-[acyl-carrier protein] reductase|nr:glucose 1-dehydrogenase [Candidatus Sulfotelmatobacter sp.]